MRAYKKNTQHPYCLYLRSDELIELLNDMTDAINWGHRLDIDFSALDKAHKRLNGLLKEPTEST